MESWSLAAVVTSALRRVLRFKPPVKSSLKTEKYRCSIMPPGIISPVVLLPNPQQLAQSRKQDLKSSPVRITKFRIDYESTKMAGSLKKTYKFVSRILLQI